MNPAARKFACPCCGFVTLSERTYWSFEVCPVCFWENDPGQSEDPLYWGGKNCIALVEAVKNFGSCGAFHSDALQQVRLPEVEELPGPAVTHGMEAAVRAKGQISLIAGGILWGKMPILDGCRAITSLAVSIPGDAEVTRRMWVFEAVSVETRETAEALRSDVENACRALREYLQLPHKEA